MHWSSECKTAFKSRFANENISSFSSIDQTLAILFDKKHMTNCFLYGTIVKSCSHDVT